MGRMTAAAIFAAAAFAGAFQTAAATTFASEKFVCPIGGEKFKASVVMSNITFGQRPDGKPYSPLPVYPIVECPGNGLLMFDEDFSRDELGALAEAIGTDEYQRMRTFETQHYRAWWLMQRIERDPSRRLGTLLQATWETDEDLDRKIRYQVEFVNSTMRLERTSENADDWFWFNARAVNALRELGHFDKAASRLAFINKPELLPSDEEQAGHAAKYLGELASLIGEDNYLSEPANLIPPDMAAVRCTVPSRPLSPSEERACQSTQVLEAIEEVVAWDGLKKLKGRDAIRYLDAKRSDQTQ